MVTDTNGQDLPIGSIAFLDSYEIVMILDVREQWGALYAEVLILQDLYWFKAAAERHRDRIKNAQGTTRLVCCRSYNWTNANNPSTLQNALAWAVK
jgi:hypothetical protein